MTIDWRRWAMRMTLLGLTAGCGSKPSVPDAGGSDGGTASDAGALRWYMTCGDPVCSTHRDAGVPACTTEDAGAPCPASGAECDPVNDCNAYLRCTASDPTAQPDGCPISSRAAKYRVSYLDELAVSRIAEALLQMPLATYEYRDAPRAGRRLGFVIDDVRTRAPFAVAADGRHVDVYGFTTMAVAALKAQAREMAALRQELLEVRRRLARVSSAIVGAKERGPRATR